jgi:hypothetical protein
MLFGPFEQPKPATPSDRLLFFAPSRVGITNEMSRMRNGRTRAQGRSYECCLRQLFPRRACTFRRSAVNIQTVGALRGQSYAQSDQLLVLLGNNTISQGGFIERPKSGHRVWSTVTKDAQIL